MEIYNDDINREIEATFGLTGLDGMKARYDIISTLEGDHLFKDAFNKIKFGVNLNIDIRLYLKGWVVEYPHNNIVEIARRWRVNIKKFWDEMEARDKLMKEMLRQCYEGDFDRQAEVNIKGYGG